MRPVLAGQVIAEPLVRQLVRHQAVGIALESGDLVDEHAVGHRRRRDVFHSAGDEVGHAYLGVLVVGVRLAGLLAEKANHLRRVAHEPPRRRLVDVLGDVVIERQIADPVVIDREISPGQ